MTKQTDDLKLREIAKRLEPDMQCNCDLDNWEPEVSTGHSLPLWLGVRNASSG
jgi:hypothetical protein